MGLLWLNHLQTVRTHPESSVPLYIHKLAASLSFWCFNKNTKLVFVHLFNQFLKLIYKQQETNHVGGNTNQNGYFSSKGETHSFM